MMATEATRTDKVVATPSTLVRGGWSSSLCDAFSGSQASRRDCCSITCFGILQHDFNRHLLNEQVSSWWTRLVVWVLLPLTFVTGIILFLDSYTASLGEDAVTQYNENQRRYDDGHLSTSSNADGPSRNGLSSGLGMTVFIIALPSYILVLSIYSSFHRRKARRILLRKIYDTKSAHANSERHEVSGIVNSNTFVQLQEADTQDAHCCLSCWGCYNHDFFIISGDDGSNNRSQRDLCSCLWTTLADMCCGWCGSWWQCCGMCALGQETRELRRIMPVSSSSHAALWQRDYITFQPWTEYIFKLEDLRTNKVTSFFKHLANLSILSQRMLLVLLAAIVWLALIAALGVDSNFALQNLLVVVATFLQAFGIMYFVHWQWNRFDVSLDAIIKYFTCGFCLCTSLAIVYEMILGAILSAIQYFVIFLGILGELDEEEGRASREEVKRMVHEYEVEHVILFALFVALNAFVIAAGVEEIAKYFSFWMLEHPDLMAPNDIVTEVRFGQRQQQHSRTTYRSVDPVATHKADNAPESKESDKPRSTNAIHARTHVSRGAAITIAMVAVSAGFACSENLLYVFIYTPPKLDKEVATLIARSLFPVHELCAALQSIGVVRRDIEGDTTSQVGRIILAAWLLHGSFDFVLMLLHLLKQQDGDDDYVSPSHQVDDVIIIRHDDDLVAQDAQNGTMALSLSLAIVSIGFVYYCVSASRQRKRLMDMDKAIAVGTVAESLAI